MRPLHVLTITPFFPSDNDATGCFVAEPIEAVSKLSIENTVFAVQPFYRPVQRATTSAVHTERIRYASLPGTAGLPVAGAFLFARLVGRIRDRKCHRPDLIHAHAPLPAGHAAMLLHEEFEIPYVVSVHGLDAFASEQSSGRAAAWRRQISRRVYRSSRRVICISELVREHVLEGVGQGCRTSVVYNGVDQTLFSPGGEASLETTVLSVGNLIPIKRHDLLIRAFASLLPEFPGLWLEIIGDGPEKSRLEALSRELSIDDRVRFLGRRTRNEVASAMRRCTVFALPSRYEGLGCVYLEAMATGRPVIGCRGQGIAEVIQHGFNGFLVGPDNEKELTLALGMLLRDESLRRKLGSAARDTILDRFTLTHQAEQLARIYRESVA